MCWAGDGVVGCVLLRWAGDRVVGCVLLRLPDRLLGETVCHLHCETEGLWTQSVSVPRMPASSTPTPYPPQFAFSPCSFCMTTRQVMGQPAIWMMHHTAQKASTLGLGWRVLQPQRLALRLSTRDVHAAAVVALQLLYTLKARRWGPTQPPLEDAKVELRR